MVHAEVLVAFSTLTLRLISKLPLGQVVAKLNDMLRYMLRILCRLEIRIMGVIPYLTF